MIFTYYPSSICRMCIYVTSPICDIDNLCLLFFFLISVTRGLSILLIFSKKLLLLSFIVVVFFWFLLHLFLFPYLLT